VGTGLQMIGQSAVLRATSSADFRRRSASPSIAAWLLICCALLFAMILVGGITRLTHSGLSITEWQPISGILPPLDRAAWTEEFRKYQATPEYQLVNRGMSLPEFQSIFWWEYVHRLLGRLIGVVFFVPLFYFAVRRRLAADLILRLGGVLALGGVQGVLGWYMVQSGLVHDPRVSPLRLAAHLVLAFLILGSMLWTALTLLYPAKGEGPVTLRPLLRAALCLSGLILVMVASGALVAGLHAGLGYNTFPLMNGHWVPPEWLAIRPWYANFYSNVVTAQFDHRLVAWALMALTPWFWWRARSRSVPGGRARRALDLLLLALVVQVVLGISTLLLVVPVPLAAAHQGGAVLLFAASVNAAHALYRESSGRPAAG